MTPGNNDTPKDLDQQLQRIYQRLDKFEERLDKLEGKVTVATKWLERMEHRLERMEEVRAEFVQALTKLQTEIALKSGMTDKEKDIILASSCKGRLAVFRISEMWKTCVNPFHFSTASPGYTGGQAKEREDLPVKKFDVSVLSASILLVGLVILGVYQSGQKDLDPALAKAGDTQITQYQLYDEMKSLYGKQMMSELVAQSLIKQEAKLQHISVSREELDKEVNAMKQQIGTDQAFRDYLSSMGMNEQKLREKMEVLLTRDKLLDKAFPVTEEQIQQYYNANKAQMGSPAPELDKVREQIKSVLADQNRSENYSKWMETIEKNHKVEWYDPTLREVTEGDNAPAPTEAETK